MSVVHLATEVSGGAGDFVRNVHLAMNRLGLPSLLLSRERKEVDGLVTLKPMPRLVASLRARGLTTLGRIGVLNPTYAIFGIETAPVSLDDIQHAIGPRAPSAFVFYWISGFVSFDTMLELKRAFPAVPFVLICLDEAFLTGACHYSFGCTGYQTTCAKCPATTSRLLQSRIERFFRRRQEAIREIDPIVIYPTSTMRKMGERSSALRTVRSYVIPLGAIATSEWRKAVGIRASHQTGKRGHPTKATLLVRSSSEYRKGCDLFVSALRILSQLHPDLRSRIEVISIGDATLTSARVDQYVDHNAMGYVNREGLISLYSRIDALLVTSREDAGPLMINECVALGVFVISTPIGVAGDLIVSARVGRITRDVSDEAIADSLGDFMERFSSQDIGGEQAPAASERLSALTFEGYIESLMTTIREEGDIQ